MAKNKLFVCFGAAIFLMGCTYVSTDTTVTSTNPTTSIPKPNTTQTPTTEQKTDIDDFEFALNDEGTYSVVSYNTFKPSTVVIPSEYKGIKVTHIDDHAFSGKTSGIEKIVLSENISYCSPLSFNESFNLYAIEIDSNNKIYCSIDGIVYDKNLTEIVFVPRNVDEVSLPSSIKKVGALAFKKSSVKKVTLNEGLETIENNAFESTQDLKEIVIPDSVTKLGNEVFSYTEASSIVIGKGITSLPYYFVNNCGSLKSIVIPGNVKTIESYAFNECRVLNSVTIEEGLETIGNCGFANCGIVNISLPSTLREIGDEAFIRNYIKNITIPEGVEKVGEGAFWACGYLQSISFPSTIKEIGVSVVAHAKELKTITIGENNKYFKVEDNILFSYDMTRLIAFPGNHPSFSYEIPNTVTKIDREAFSSLKRLDDLTIPKSVTTIGAYCFRETSRLKSVKYLGTVLDWAQIVKTEEYYRFNDDDGSYSTIDVPWNDSSSIEEVICTDKTIKL